MSQKSILLIPPTITENFLSKTFFLHSVIKLNRLKGFSELWILTPKKWQHLLQVGFSNNPRQWIVNNFFFQEFFCEWVLCCCCFYCFFIWEWFLLYRECCVKEFVSIWKLFVSKIFYLRNTFLKTFETLCWHVEVTYGIEELG